ncbi:MAG: carbon-nitrogen hydrolase family protein [Caldisphaera sp.]|uniref:carbon-nitrogen hydrolase family protein n=1 Tax=Caldisphaera sp. TaxID=2060322 RepID=UPI003D1384A6
MAILHTRIKLGARRTNMKRLEEIINRVMIDHDDIDLIYLPAYPLTGPIVGYYPNQKVKNMLKNYAERLNESEIQQNQTFMSVSKWSHEFGIYVIAGPIVERAGPRLYLTVFASNPQGELAGKYRKIAITKAEDENGLTPGKNVEIFNVKKKDANVGVFIDEDLGYPEIFKALSYMGANVIVGTMLPYESRFFKMKSESETSILTLDIESINNFLAVRSKETDLPVVLVGGAVEGVNNNGYVAFMPTITSEPEIGVVKERIMGYDDIDLPVIIEVDTSAKSLQYDSITKLVLKNLCRKSGSEENEEEI